MTQTDRLKAILERQNAADRAQVAELTRQAATESHARAARTRTEGDWSHLCRVLTQTVATANDAMTGGRKIYLQRWQLPASRMADVILMFEDNYPDYVQRKCVASVDREGTVSVMMNEGMPQSRIYRMNVSSATPEQIEGIVYDFMELNIETPAS
jgi:hypothetical protein